jgi:urease gamma subunit
VQLRTNDPGAVVRDARNEGKNVMNRDPVVEGVKPLMRNVFMKLSCDGVEERSTNPDSELVSPMLRFLRIR